ncbi:hypothetical protein H310_04481 [Aphanomyces invadans]|uniref:Calcineurin-like phosphoesterase domain-containing protein n=1 Tax=Aphanomyces invadans TaxID=157072 RepID=A0A024UCH0_9STRA|nr:hypothetical protein H310_04481 [Aphanomyces invadans]ETW04121.1 hypothetical protein H310_04481 [Aphanomyces invadans]|eukprot:XP_008867077.1 hypothetical protein H310_04481 [Aphanomyces invadans]
MKRSALPRQWSMDSIQHSIFLMRRRISWRKAIQFLLIVAVSVSLLYALSVNLFVVSTHKYIHYSGLDLDVVAKPPLVARAVRAQSHEPPLLAFTILQIPDMHYTGNPNHPCRNPPPSEYPCTEANMTAFVASLLDDVKPDFVVFTGDQIESVEVHQSVYQVNQALYAFSKGTIERNIPWAMVFGNHDQGDSMSKREMFRRLNAMPLSYSEFGPKTSTSRVGNYHLQIDAPVAGTWGPSGKALLRLYFLDSEDGQFTPDQQTHLLDVAAQHAHQHVPALVFFHNPLPEYAEFESAIKNDLPRQGHLGEAVTHAHTNSHLFETILQMGDVKATFAGHDHLNDYCFRKDSVHLCYGGGVGYGAAYGNDAIPRRARVIEWALAPREEVITTHLVQRSNTGSITHGESYLIYQRKNLKQSGIDGGGGLRGGRDS